jgi:hypothetical protein
MLKYLRIAVTALSLTACVLLIALWVRSYYCLDVVRGQLLNAGVQFVSTEGSLLCYASWGFDKLPWLFRSMPEAEIDAAIERQRKVAQLLKQMDLETTKRSPTASNTEQRRIALERVAEVLETLPHQERERKLRRLLDGSRPWTLPNLYFGLGLGRSNNGYVIACSYWALIVVGIALAAIAVIPISSRFSLRTLLIATVLVAVALALVVKLVAAPSASPAAIALSDLAGQWKGKDMRLTIEKSGMIKGMVGYSWSDGRRVVWNGVAENVKHDRGELSMKLGQFEWTAAVTSDGKTMRMTAPINNVTPNTVELKKL